MIAHNNKAGKKQWGQKYSIDFEQSNKYVSIFSKTK